MGHHIHLTLRERKDIMLMRRKGKGVFEIARAIGHDKSTVSRELKRNSCARFYRASAAQRRYAKRRLACHRQPILDDERNEPGHWEGDTVAGKAGKACLLTLVDRKDGFLVGGKCRRKAKECVRVKIPKALEGQLLASVTLDKGKKFAAHAQVTADIGVQFYFALPHHLWQRGTNKNTNGLLREYFPKGESLVRVSEKRV